MSDTGSGDPEEPVSPDVIVYAPARPIGGSAGAGGSGSTGGSRGGAPGGTGGNTPEPIRNRVLVGGTATDDDAILVVGKLEKLPSSVRNAIILRGIKIVVARGSVADYRTDLKTKRPRGWPIDATWEDVQGAFIQDTNEVVIAIVGHDTAEGAHLPKFGEGNGSQDGLIHEIAHALGKTTGARGSAAFIAARDADFANLTPYEKQSGPAGLSETYAESAARFYGGRYGTISTPRLDDYFRAHPLGSK